MKDIVEDYLAGVRKDSERRARKLKAKAKLAETQPGIADDCREIGIVVSTTRSGCSVLLQDEVHDIALAAKIKPGRDVVVGDKVVLTDGPQGKSIESVLPRTTSLGRPDPHVPERIRVLAANIDLVIAVVPAGESGIRSRLADRFLIAAVSGGAQAMICVTKIDLLEPESLDVLHRALEPYRQIDVQCIMSSAVSGSGIAELRECLQGKLSVLVGQSGVGKSSILNALNPTLDIRVNEVRESDGKGQHTTTGSRAYGFGQNTLIIDTPGIRQIGLVGIDAASLCRYFPEFTGFDSVCKFSDCSHIHEPDCGVKMAVSDGQVSVERYKSYCKLAMEISNGLGPADSDEPE